MMTIRMVLERLAEEGLSGADGAATVAPTLSVLDDAAGNPWYLRVLVGIGAWIAAVLLITFLVGGARIINSAESMVAAGLILCGLAIAIRRTVPASVFGAQLALALSMAGQVLFGGGVASRSSSVPTTVLAIIVLEVALIAIYPDMVHRFLSSVVIAGAIVGLLLYWDLPGAVHPLVGLLAAGAVWLWECESAMAAARVETLSRPIGYGLSVGLLGVLCLGLTALISIPHWWISGLLLLPALLALEYRIVSQFETRIAAAIVPWLVGGTVLVSFPALLTPGILAAVIVLALGFRRGNRLLLGLGVFGLVVFLIAFYYHLEVTLLVKSLMLLGTGLLLLVLRSVMPQEPRL